MLANKWGRFMVTLMTTIPQWWFYCRHMWSHTLGQKLCILYLQKISVLFEFAIARGICCTKTGIIQLSPAIQRVTTKSVFWRQRTHNIQFNSCPLSTHLSITICIAEFFHVHTTTIAPAFLINWQVDQQHWTIYSISMNECGRCPVFQGIVPDRIVKSVLTLSITMANCDCKLYSSP